MCYTIGEMDTEVREQPSAFANLRKSTKAFLERHADARPADPNLRPAGSYAEDFPEEHEAARNRPPARP